ncbi:hypothetical protein I316_07822 [Kwoniella heveanensis BCC8398]|uniref:Uncharacterized protein n=1 Tax=Kwoniella heveanensis BCC8398 TaxID=1296120 RepID=A0A1B9GHK6_9TREE|nr:hypothetical protein I316_07822 [Kwoniella heveanensis BCC8398]
MVKSQRSSTKLFHQWPANSNSHSAAHERAPPTPTSVKKGKDIAQPYTPGHTSHHHHESSGGGFGTLTSRVGIAGIGMGIGIGIGFGNARTPALASVTGPPTAAIIAPGSPSQTDPFGSQVTSPTLSRSPIPPTPVHAQSSQGGAHGSHGHGHGHGHSTSSNSNSVRSRPPSTVLSSSSNSPSVGIVTPKIILASPSTSTIHYLFPSSDTKTGLHLDPNTATTAATTTTITIAPTSKPAAQEGVRRNQSVSKRDRNRTSVVIGNQIEHRDIPGIKNKRSLPSSAASQQRSGSAANALAPTKKVVSAASPGGLRKSDIGKPIPSAADEGRDYSKGYYDITPAPAEEEQEDDMGSLRRQPAMVDLSGRGKIGLRSQADGTVIREEPGGFKRKGSIILKEIENRRERRGWEIGSKKTTATTRSGVRGPVSRPYIPPITIIQQRRRSQSLSSPRPAPSPPVDGRISPLLPAPDFGDPLSLSVVIPSPSYSHLEYSLAGSSVSSASQRGSKNWAKRSSVIFPMSSAMMRGDTRMGLGGYDAGKLKAREDAERRLTGEREGGRFASLKRSVSLRKKSEEGPRRARPRSQSLGSRSIRVGVDSAEQLPPPPLPVHLRRPYRPSSEVSDDSAFIGGLSIDLGSRYINVNPDTFSPRDHTPSTSFASPQSADTSIFPASTPTSDCQSAIIENVIRIVGKPLHPAFNESDVSILAPSTIGLGFSPVGTPVSLPESLKAEVIDLTETGRRVSSPMTNNAGSHDGTSIVTPPTPHNDGNLPKPTHLHVKDDSSSAAGSASSSARIPRRSLLLAQNRFYLPPTHPKPVTGLQKKPSLRPSKSLGPGLIKRAYTSTSVKDHLDHPTGAASSSSNIESPDVAAGGVTASSTSASFGKGLLKSASIRSTTRRLSKVFEGEDRSGIYQEQHTHGTERMGTTPSMRFGRRPLTAFSLCSPSDAIDPLPYTSPGPSSGYPHSQNRERSKDHHSNHSRPHSTLRSNKSSPFLSASNSLRVIFGREGFVARSLSQAFERESPGHHALPRDRSDHVYELTRRSASSAGQGAAEGQDLKSRISSPLEADRGFEGRSTSLTSRSRAHEEAKERGRSADRAWRESVLQEAVSLSISSGLNKLAESPIVHDSANDSKQSEQQPRMVSSGSKSRLAIPDTLLAAPTIRESSLEPDWSDLGETMMKPSKGSIKSGLSLKAVVQDWAVPQRFLGQVGKEESSGMVSAPSVYSNGASTYVERPSRRPQGKGFPSSFSIADLKSRSLSKASRRSPSRSPLVAESACRSNNSKSNESRGVRERGISPPIPITGSVGGDRDNEEGMEELRDSRYIPSTSIYDADPPSVHGPLHSEDAKEVTKPEAGLRTSASRSGLFSLSLRSKAPSLTAGTAGELTGSKPARSPSPSQMIRVSGESGRSKPAGGFGLSLRTRASIRSQRVGKTPMDTVKAEGGVYRTPSGGIGNSSTFVHVHEPQHFLKDQKEREPQRLLDALVARDAHGIVHSQIGADFHTHAEAVSTQIEVGDHKRADAEEREREKVRKVLEWRDEVGENEDIARLEERMRGFVVGEKERIKVIGRRRSGSGSGEMLRV